jgi:hypothetical protein
VSLRRHHWSLLSTYRSDSKTKLASQEDDEYLDTVVQAPLNRRIYAHTVPEHNQQVILLAGTKKEGCQQFGAVHRRNIIPAVPH